MAGHRKSERSPAEQASTVLFNRGGGQLQGNRRSRCVASPEGAREIVLRWGHVPEERQAGRNLEGRVTLALACRQLPIGASSDVGDCLRALRKNGCAGPGTGRQ